jgi:hypothetical protein
MKKHEIYSILGLISTCVILINYLIHFVISEFGVVTNGALLLISLFSMFSGLVVFISIRFIIVIYSKLDQYRIVLLLIIIAQFLTSILTLLTKYQTIPLMYLVAPLIIVGLVLIGSYIWFFVLLSKTEDVEIRGLPLLQYYGISLLSLVTLFVIFSIFLHQGIKASKPIFQLIEALPYVFLLLFFIRHFNVSRSEEQQNTYA